jgi:hypothetical protein
MDPSYGEISQEVSKQPCRFNAIYADLTDLKECLSQRSELAGRLNVDPKVKWVTLVGFLSVAAWRKVRH